MQKGRLVLFDIDCTLINTGGAGTRALQLVIKNRYGVDDDLHDIEIAGRTDSGIVARILQKYGIEPTSENIAAFLDAYVERLRNLLPEIQGRVLPGIAEILPRLHSDSNHLLGLLTGNVRRGAKLKLEYYGLWQFFRFGAFADDHHDRNELGLVACARALEHSGRRFEGRRIDVIGDTEHDIACGKAIGARTIAVATGSWSRERLAQAQPDFLFDDLSQVDEAIATLDW